jgi:cytochrome c biogenesis factor
VALTKIERNQENPALSKATFALMDSSIPETIPKEFFVVDASVKPFINLVWSGVILLVAGFFVAIFRHLGESVRERRNEQKSSEGNDPVIQQAAVESTT